MSPTLTLTETKTLSVLSPASGSIGTVQIEEIKEGRIIGEFVPSVNFSNKAACQSVS